MRDCVSFYVEWEKKVSTVFVLGAGASHDVGLPVGDGLKTIISRALNFDKDIHERASGGDFDVLNAIRLHAQSNKLDINRYLTASHDIAAAMPLQKSIDTYIDQQSHSEEIAFCGKLAIAKGILAAEGASSLNVTTTNVGNSIRFDALDKPLDDKHGTPWYNQMFKMLFNGVKGNDLEERLARITFIIFNYDRCLEQYLYYAFRNVYGLSPEEAQDFVNGMNVFHPYGKVGDLFDAADSPFTSYGRKPEGDGLPNIAFQLRTFAEGTNEVLSEVLAIRESVHNAKQIIFLGFAFHKLNMELISYPGPPSASRIFATTLSMSPHNRDIHQNSLSRISHDGPILPSVDCMQLLSDYEGRMVQIIEGS